MKTITFEELFSLIEFHMSDKVTYRIELVEYNQTCCSVKLLEEGKKFFLPILENSMYDLIFDSFQEHFQEKLGAVKVLPVFSPEYMFLMIGHEVCVYLRYQFQKGQDWIRNPKNGIVHEKSRRFV